MAKVVLDLGADIQPVSDFRAHASDMLKQTKASGRPIVLTQRGRGTAVLLDIDAYQALLDELEELRSVCRGLADVDAGRLLAHEDVERDVLARFERG